jgi:hypothetical protein
VSRKKLRGAKQGPKNGKDLPVNTNFWNSWILLISDDLTAAEFCLEKANFWLFWHFFFLLVKRGKTLPNGKVMLVSKDCR